MIDSGVLARGEADTAIACHTFASVVSLETGTLLAKVSAGRAKTAMMRLFWSWRIVVTVREG